MKIKFFSLVLIAAPLLAVPPSASADHYVAVSVDSGKLYNQLCNCSVTLLQSGSAQFGLSGITSGPPATGTLSWDVYLGSGPPGQPFYIYEYSINANLLGPAANHCLRFDLLEPGGIMESWDFDGTGKLTQIFSLTDSQGGTGVPVLYGSGFGNDISLVFGPDFSHQCGLTPGHSSMLFGFISRKPPISVSAEVTDELTDPVTQVVTDYPAKLQTVGPDDCALVFPFSCAAVAPTSLGNILQGLILGGPGNPNPNPPNGMYSMQFQLFDAPTNGNPISGILTQQVNVANGLFTAGLDFGPNSFHPPEPCFLDVAFMPPGAGWIHFAPRLAQSSAPYADHAAMADGVFNLGAGQAVLSLNGLQDSVVLVPGTNVTITPTNNMLVLSSAGVVPGSIMAADLATPGPPTDGQVLAYSNNTVVWQNACACPIDWHLTGNSGTTAGLDFLGTTDNQPLEFHVNSARTARFEPSSGGPNVILGASLNYVTTGPYGAAIGGGGGIDFFSSMGLANYVTADFGTIGGGNGNVAGDNNPTNFFDSGYATVGGGYHNTASGQSSFVGGGDYNVASGGGAVVGGGDVNKSLNGNSTVGGGNGNIASGFEASILGGFHNIADGFTSTIGAGKANTTSNAFDVISGGSSNTIAFASLLNGNDVIAGGSDNRIIASEFGTIGGGTGNLIWNGPGNFTGTGSTIPGGAFNAAGGNYSFAAGYAANADHHGSFVWNGNSTPAHSQFDHRFHVFGTNGFYVQYTEMSPAAGPATAWVEIGPDLKGGNPGRTISTWTGAYLSDSGVWLNVSDRNRKTDFSPVDAPGLLQKVASLPIQSWRYTNEVQSIRHLGPTAQDFKAAFALGDDDKTIGSLDEAGVALAAIQALQQEVRKRDAEIRTLKQRVVSLEEQMDTRLTTLEAAVANPGLQTAPLRMRAGFPEEATSGQENQREGKSL